jgi:hypothetical protein
MILSRRLNKELNVLTLYYDYECHYSSTSSKFSYDMIFSERDKTRQDHYQHQYPDTEAFIVFIRSKPPMMLNEVANVQPRRNNLGIAISSYKLVFHNDFPFRPCSFFVKMNTESPMHIINKTHELILNTDDNMQNGGFDEYICHVDLLLIVYRKVMYYYHNAPKNYISQHLPCPCCFNSYKSWQPGRMVVQMLYDFEKTMKKYDNYMRLVYAYWVLNKVFSEKYLRNMKPLIYKLLKYIL